LITTAIQAILLVSVIHLETWIILVATADAAVDFLLTFFPNNLRDPNQLSLQLTIKSKLISTSTSAIWISF